MLDRVQFANWLLVGEQALELERDVARGVLIAVERTHAVSLCAAPQPPYTILRLPHRILHGRPRATRMKATIARLAGVRLWRERDDKALSQLSNQAHSDARRSASVACHAWPPGSRSPHPVGEDEWSSISLELALDVMIEALFALLQLNERLPTPLAVI